MELSPRSVMAVTNEATNAVAIDAACSSFRVGPLAVHVDLSYASGFSWWIENQCDREVSVRSVSVCFDLEGLVGSLRILRHGYQSWSPTDVATLGDDRDPSTSATLEFFQAVHHADQRTVDGDGLRSEWFTMLADARDGDADALLLGFLGGSQHDGTFRVALGLSGLPEVAVEAYLGDATLAPGEQRPLHTVRIDSRGAIAPATKLGDFVDALSAFEPGRVHREFQVGWCSWYQYFHEVTEGHIRSNLADASTWPFEVFQIDDGYQSGIGDWLTTNDKFPSGLEALAIAIAKTGMTAGIWLAPFLAAPDSSLLREHPGFVARHRGGGPLRTWWNPPWGGGDGGFMYGLDTTNPEVLAHLESTAHSLVAMGYQYLKLDFTFSPSADGVYADPSRTPAQRVRAGFEAIRRGAGEDCFLLACGVPLANVIGVVDAVRIGQDVAPTWALDPSEEVVPGYLATQPATQLAAASTMYRAFLHRKTWLNDPDCVMLRRTQTDMSAEATATWAELIGVSGGMVLVSDDLHLLDGSARALLEGVIERGRSADRQCAQGDCPIESDVLAVPWPTRIASGAGRLGVDLARGVCFEL